MNLRQLKGTKEFLPKEQIVREYIVDTLKEVFKLYGYKPIETSILEFYDIASSKYAGGSEILKETYTLKDQGNRDLVLRYELTFKLAKLVGLNPDIRFPFKRYEIGKVFRDGPVKTGRLREFTQCDVDVVGVKSEVVNSELMSLVSEAFKRLGLKIYVEVNNRKLLFGIMKEFGIEEDKFVDFALSLDKIEKIGKKGVEEELLNKGFDKKVVDKVFGIVESTDKIKDNFEKIKFLKEKLSNELASEGIIELEEFFNYCKGFNIQDEIILSPNLSRGLGYYTGTIFEVFLKDSNIKSSIAAGGRWDNMIQKFLGSKLDYPATGLAFGLDVIYEAIKEKGLGDVKVKKIPQVLIVPIKTLNKTLSIASELRKEGISCDIAFNKKLSKALNYANKEDIPYCLIIGDEEIEKKEYKLKNMRTGEENLMSLQSIIKKLKS